MSSEAAALTLTALAGIPLVRPGDDLAVLISSAILQSGIALHDGDVVVLAQKVVSKAEGRQVALASITPSARALELGQRTAKDPRLVELILSESTDVMRAKKGVLIVRHRLGLVLANAGIDQSNIAHGDGAMALLLPIDPDASASRLRTALHVLTGAAVAVVIVDSLGRAWRLGTTGTAIGVSGIEALRNLRGQPDLYGRKLETSEVGYADEVAAAASLLMGQGGEGTPVVHVRGLRGDGIGSAGDLVRPIKDDLFL